MNGFNLSNITDARLGGTQLSAIYLGSSKLWPLRHDYSQDYFTIEALEHTMIRLHKNTTSGTKRVVVFSRNGQSWNRLVTEYDSGDYEYDYIELSAGEKVYIKYSQWSNTTTSDYAYFTSSNSINVYGNVNSIRDNNFTTNKTIPDQDHWFYRLFYKLKIVDATNLVLPYTTLRNYCYMGMFEGCTTLTNAPAVLPATTLATGCYYSMFQGCTSLSTAPVLPATTLASSCYSNMFQNCTSLTAAPELPATTLTGTYCYSYMFRNCTSLTAAPELPATTLTADCYGNMFRDCTSLSTAPALPATTLANYCYEHMFRNCTSLTAAPELPATTLVKSCYVYMFKSCTSLSYIKCLATDISASSSLTNWVSNVAATGTFVKPSSMTSWTTDANGIPSGWTVVNI